MYNIGCWNFCNSFFCIRNSQQGGDIEKATDWIFNPTNISSSSDMDVSSSSTSIVDSPLPDGGGGQSPVVLYNVFVHGNDKLVLLLLVLLLPPPLNFNYS